MRLILALIFHLFLVNETVLSDTKTKRPSFPITRENTNINSYEYVKYVRPQLRSIVSEFYKIIALEAPIMENFLPVRKSYNDMYKQLQKLKSFCVKSESLDLCSEKLSQIRLKLAKIEKLTFKIESKALNKTLKGTRKENNFDKLWNYSLETKRRSYSSKIGLELGRIYNLLSDLQLNLKLGYFDNVTFKTLRKSAFKLSTQIDLLIWKFLTPKKQKLVEAVWANYMQKIENHILRAGNKEYLKLNLETLNFNWNLFHMQMAKGHLKPSAKILNLIQTMHRRWNSILKVILN